MPNSLLPFQLYSDAESSFAQVLKLDKHCEDAMFELARVRVQQLEVWSSLRLLITFSGAVRKMFRTRVIFGGTMDNYISMERL